MALQRMDTTLGWSSGQQHKSCITIGFLPKEDHFCLGLKSHDLTKFSDVTFDLRVAWQTVTKHSTLIWSSLLET